jgi:hypothetical protein
MLGNTRDAKRMIDVLTLVLVLVMATQAVMGLLFETAYRDVDWIKATWFGNDCMTLFVAVPLLVVGLVSAGRGSPRGLLLWAGLLGYAVYNYAFYLLGAALNVFFPLYVLAVVLAVSLLVLVLMRANASRVAAYCGSSVPVRVVGGSLVVVALGLASAWMAMWAAHVFGGRPTPVDPAVFRLVAALDLSLMAPALLVGGVLLWRRKPWGYVIASIASIQAALYLLVLSVNSIIAITRGLTAAPGELPIWGSLAALMTTMALVLLFNVKAELKDSLCEASAMPPGAGNTSANDAFSQVAGSLLTTRRTRPR